ncbi:hypothetical protein Efla_001451 [Eimeria flavescens]
MADTTTDAPGSANPESALSWMPHALFILSFLLGICCLFFMSSGGIVLCILHCIIGTLAALVTYGTRTKNHQLMAMVAVLFNFLYWLVLICTFIYTAWLLSIHAKAKKDMNNGVTSPALRPLLDAYSAYVSGEEADPSPGARRLQAVEQLFTTSARQTLLELESLEKDTQYTPAVLRQGTTPTKLTDLKFSQGDAKCLAKLAGDDDFSDKVNKRVDAFLDYGLFCGYTKYKAGAMRKWPISCNDDCLFDKLHFSKIRKDNAKTKRQTDEFKVGLNAMGQEKGKMVIGKDRGNKRVVVTAN